jgi:hypothetical protein
VADLQGVPTLLDTLVLCLSLELVVHPQAASSSTILRRPVQFMTKHRWGYISLTGAPLLSTLYIQRILSTAVYLEGQA